MSSARPARQRKAVSHYSDDNPNTFTVKRRKGDPPAPPAVKRRGKRPCTEQREQQHQKQQQQRTPPVPTKKAKSTRKRMRVVPTDSSSEPTHTEVVVPHAVSLQPVTTLTTTTTTATSSWTLLPSAHQQALLQRHGPNGTTVELPPPAVTCWAVHDEHDGKAVGDVAGGVTLYVSSSPSVLLHTAAWKREQERVISSKTTISYPNCVHSVAWRGRHVVCVTQHEVELFSIQENSNNNNSNWSTESVKLWDIASHAAANVLLDHGSLDVLEKNGVCHVLWCTTSRETTLVEECRAKEDQSNLIWMQQASEDDARVGRCALPGMRLCVTAIWNHHSGDSELQALVVAVQEDTDQALLLKCNHDNNLSVVQKAPAWDLPSPARLECRLQQSGHYTFLSSHRGIRMFNTETLNCITVFGESVALHGKTVWWHSCQWVPPMQEPESSMIRTRKKQVWLERPDELLHRLNKKKPDPLTAQQEADEYWMVGIPHPFKGPEELRSTLYVWKIGVPTPITTLKAPAQGCLGLSVEEDINFGWKLTAATAESGEMMEWKTLLKSNFAGVMYPVGYQVVDDNIEYIEDEDELDQTVVFETDGKQGDTVIGAYDGEDELQRALKLSLLEQERESQRRKEKELEQEPVDVLGEQASDSMIDIPCRPDMSLFETWGTSPVGSPTRDGSTSKKDGFDSIILSALPQTRQVLRSFQQMSNRAKQLERIDPDDDDNISGNPALPPRFKGKRHANIEALLQASVKPDLRRKMVVAQASWGDGQGSMLSETESMENQANVKSTLGVVKGGGKDEPVTAVPGNETSVAPDEKDSKLLSVSINCSAEEKELAMELLLLSPGRTTTPLATDASKAPRFPIEEKMQDGQHTSSTDNIDSVVTPSESSPNGAVPVGNVCSAEKTSLVGRRTNRSTCPACRGRLVIHRCGKREKPIDYEAIERAAREKKEKEEAEKQRIRIEKRRAADAKRREARKKKKEEEERKRREEEEKRLEQEERMRKLEEERFEAANIREHEDEPVPQQHGFQPAFSPGANAPQARTASLQSNPSYHHSNSQDSTYSSDGKGGGTSTTPNWSGSPRRGSLLSIASSMSGGRNEPLRIDGTEVQPSTSISSSDALAALAGLADAMPIAVAPAPARDAFPRAPASWYTNSSTEVETEPEQQRPTPPPPPPPPPQPSQQQEVTQYYATQYQHDVPTHNPVAETYQPKEMSVDRRTAIAEAFLSNFSNFTASDAQNGSGKSAATTTTKQHAGTNGGTTNSQDS